MLTLNDCSSNKLKQVLQSFRSSGEDYGDDAVGYVQVRRSGGVCEVAARVTPEHKVTSKPYRVHVMINEVQEEIIEAKCLDCTAAEGQCKHAAAFLSWLSRRSAKKSVTSTVSYWKKAKLSTVTSASKTTNLKGLRPMPRKSVPPTTDIGDQFFAGVLAGAHSSTVGQIFDFFGNYNKRGEELAVDNLLQSFLKEQCGEVTCEQFLQYAKSKMTPELCKAIQQETTAQAQSSLWHIIRFARITASKAYTAAHQSTEKISSFVMSVLGAAKVKDTMAMKRGRELEPVVISALRKQIGNIIQSGIILSPDHPVLGASPDGLTADGQAVVEVKCPVSEKSFSRYINKNGTVAARYIAQLQMLMYMSGRNSAFFCVASPQFEINKIITIKKIYYDQEYCKTLLHKCQTFWEQTVFLELYKSYK